MWTLSPRGPDWMPITPKTGPIPRRNTGNAPDAIPQRLARGEPTDIIILARPALDDFSARSVVRPDSRVDLAESRIGVAVRAGAPKPDISTVDALRRTLLGASSIAYSASASGVYISTELYKRLGIEAEVMPKGRRILSERAAAVVARGEAEIGFQQISEIIGIPGAELVGPLPAEVQQVTVFSAGVLTIARQPEAAAELSGFWRPRTPPRRSPQRASIPSLTAKCRTRNGEDGSPRNRPGSSAGSWMVDGVAFDA